MNYKLTDMQLIIEAIDNKAGQRKKMSVPSETATLLMSFLFFIEFVRASPFRHKKVNNNLKATESEMTGYKPHEIFKYIKLIINELMGNTFQKV